MQKIREFIKKYRIILPFTLLFLAVHLLTNSNYILHRDAYLYLAQSKHLDWSFFSSPPLTAALARLHTIIFGDSVWAVRLLPTFIGSINMFIVGWLIIRLKGGWIAQTVSMTAYLLSPAFLRPAMLLQPIITNHFFWLMIAVVVFLMVEKQRREYLLLMIPVLGLGWLNKYSIVFYGFAMLAGIILSRHRKLIWSHYLIWTITGGLVLIIPNILWQYHHNWPVLYHMSELQATQLVNVRIGDFLLSQLFMHFSAIPVWLGGLLFLLFGKSRKTYRVFAWAFIFTLLTIILLRGKYYYTIAAYTILFVFGGLAWEEWIKKSHITVMAALMAIIMSTGIFSLPFSLPVFKPERMIVYDQNLVEKGLDVMLKWEDGKVHDLPQDYADMVGWDELGNRVWGFYESLDDSIKNSILIYGENYGLAGSMLYYRPDNSYPEVFSFSDAFMLWIPRYFYAKYFIYVGYSDRLPNYFDRLEKVGEVEDPYFRERGVPIYFGSHPTQKLYDDWEETWQETAGRFTH